MREGLNDTLRKHRSVVLAFALAIVLFLIGTVQASGFASYDHIRTILITASFIGLVGVGQTLCMLTGGIDLSIPSNLAGAAVLTAFLANGSSSSLIWIIPLVIALGAVIGLINGLGVAYAGVPPIIMTLGMNSAIQGILLIYTHGGLAASAPSKLVNFANGDTLGVSTMVLFWLVVAIVVSAVLSLSTFGRKLYAVGTNSAAARLAGVDVKRVLVVPYVVSGAGAAVTGVLLLGYLGQAFITMGDTYLFSSAVAVAVGGASILGGKGHYVGTIAGAIILTLITANLNLISLGTSAIDIAYGVILLGTVYLATLRLRRGQSPRLVAVLADARTTILKRRR
jgi:ribose transport system permease protein